MAFVAGPRHSSGQEQRCDGHSVWNVYVQWRHCSAMISNNVEAMSVKFVPCMSTIIVGCSDEQAQALCLGCI